MAAVTKAQIDFERTLQSVGVFVPPLVSEEYPVSILEILSAFFVKVGVAKQMSDLVWQRIKASTDLALNEMKMMPNERTDAQAAKTSLDKRVWTVDEPTESEDAYAYRMRLQAKIQKYHAALYEVSKEMFCCEWFDRIMTFSPFR